MSLRRRSAVLSAGALVTLMLVTAGCSASSDTAADKSGSSDSSADTAKDEVDNGSAAAGIDLQNLPKPIASLTVHAPYDQDLKATARFDVYSIKRQGKLAILTMSVTPTFSTVKRVSLFGLMGERGFRPTLVDPINLRSYRVVRSNSSPLITDEVGAKAHSGEPMFIWAAFAAPPAGVAKVNLNLYDTVPAILDMPVQ